MTLEEILEVIKKEYDNKKYSKEIERLVEKITSGKGSYIDVYEFAESMGNGLGDSLKQFLQYEEVANVGQYMPIMEQYAHDVSDACAIVQRQINTETGLGIRAIEADIDRTLANQVLRDVVFSEDAKKIVSHFGLKTVDNNIESNASFVRKTGYPVTLTRKYDGVGLHRRTKWAESCSWCLERVGVYPYSTSMDNKVFERHEGCKCTIEVKYGKTIEKVKNYKRKVEPVQIEEKPALQMNLNLSPNDVNGMREQLAVFGGFTRKEVNGMGIQRSVEAYNEFKRQEIEKRKSKYESVNKMLADKAKRLESDGYDVTSMTPVQINSIYKNKYLKK